MGAGCCKADVELNPDNTPKDPQTKEQRKEDAKELRRAALAADWAQMRTLLRRMPLRQICGGADKQEAGEDDIGNTALHYSVSINHLRGVKKLLRYGIPPHLANKAGKTPLHLALETGKLKAARALLDKSVEPRKAPQSPPKTPIINAQDAKGVTPLLAVVAAGRLKLAREVLGICKELEIGINYDVVDSEGNSLVLFAAKWGWFDELAAWIDHLTSPRKILNVQNKEGETVLGHVLMFRASGLLDKERALGLVTRLIELGALPKLPSFKERVPLINLAAAADDKGIYDLLWAKGGQPLKARDVLGRSPLHYAAAKGARGMAAEMLNAGIKAYAVDGQGNTPLHLAAMRGQEGMVPLLLERADNKVKALLTPNKSGLTAYHLALRAGPDERAQRNSLALIEQLGERFTTPVLGPKKKVVDTPLMLAIQGHQDRVVKALLQKGMSPNERNAAGELPLARALRCATSSTYDNDSTIFDQLMAAGADMAAASDTAHPLLALCKNNLSRFAEKVVGVLNERFRGQLDWNKRDDKGYTPLALAAFHDNAWLVRYLVDEIKVDPNSESQRSTPTAPEVVGTTGGLCSSKPITRPGTVPGQTPLMCAAKGASVAAVQLLLNRGADVHAVDAEGRTALQHAMQLDKAASLQVAAALLRAGAHPGRGVRTAGGQWLPCTDLVGEYWPHRAVRYGVSSFLAMWAECGGELDSLLATTADDADDMPGAEIKAEEKTDFLDILPSRVNNIVEAEDEELADEYNGEDSEQAPPGEDNEGDGTTNAARPVAEGVEAAIASSSESSEEDCGEEEEAEGQGEGDELAALLASGQAESFYTGPTPRQILQWRRRGMQWWDEFWVDRDSLPDTELEDDPHWEDKYTLCEEGDEWIDEEDVEEEIWEQVRAEQRSIANAVRRAREAAAAAEQQREQQREGDHCVPDDGREAAVVTEALLTRVSSGLAHKLFRHRLPNAAVPETAPGVDEGTFAAGSPTKWLRRKSSNSISSAPSPAADSSPDGPPMTPSSATSATTTTASLSPNERSSPATTATAPSPLKSTPPRQSGPAAAAAPLAKLKIPSGSGRRLPKAAAAAVGPGPVAEAKETPSQDIAVVDLEAVSPAGARPSPPQSQDSQGRRSLRFQTGQPGGCRDDGGAADDQDPAPFIPDPVPQRIVSMGRSQSSKSASSAASFGKAASAVKTMADVTAAMQAGGVTAGVNAALGGGGAVLDKAFSSVKGKLTAGVSGERLYGNEPYYQPDTLYDGLPRYMKVPTEPFPNAKYDKYVSDLEARVKSYKIKDEKRLEGADLRARNISWYHKSMSPTEYPLKPGKWKSFQRMSAKAVEQARQRRPLKPGEKPQIRKKKVWFGLPDMPSRPELSLTSPLVYAVRLGRVKCVEVLLRVGGGGELVDIPDGHGVTPLSYAMYMLARDRHNKALQQMVDLLLVARPRVDTNELWSGYLRPRMDKQLAALQAAEAAGKGGEGGLSKADKQMLKDLRMMASLFQSQGGGAFPPNYAKLFPSLLDPLILGAMLGDVGRLTYLVQQLGADPNVAWVWLPDIPTYFQGMMEKQLSRCNSRCGPLHVAVCVKQYDVVRSLLDLGFDPNNTGEEYSGDGLKDAAKRAKLAAERRKEVEERKQAAATFNPYTRLWGDRPSALKALLMGAKRLISSIQIPGLTRPHPWLSPLHLACRLGQPDITFLLVKRGAAVNGGAASAFAPKSPLEEALMYARENAQAYGTTSNRSTYKHILEEACLAPSDRMASLIADATKLQADEHAALVQKLRAHAESLVAKGVKGKNGKTASVVDLMLAIRDFEVAQLATYDPVSLKYIAVPGANAAVLESKAMKLYSDVMAMMDPVKGAIKAVTLAAKIIIKILLDMMKRPIAHFDPALACAHVMLHFRAPLNVSEKQTGVLIRDILDNSNTLAESADPRMSSYRWLGIDPATVQETVWVQSVVNKINVLKANVEYGYMAMDMAMTYKEYDKAKKKFMSQVESSIFNIGASSITPHYMKKVLETITSRTAAAAPGATGAAVAAGWPPGSLEAMLDAMFEQYCAVTANRGKQQGEPPASDAELDQAARDLLPAWLLTAPPPPSAEDAAAASGAPAAEAVINGQSTRQEIKTFLIKRFVRYTVAGAEPQQYLPPPVPPNMADLVLQSNDLKHEKPVISEDALAAVQPTQNDISDADVCTAVVRAHNALLVQRVQSHSEALRLRTQARQAAAEARRALIRQAGKVSTAVSVQLALAGMTSGQLAFDEGPIFEAAVVDPMWEAAVSLLGGSPGARAMITRLRAAAASGDVPRIPDPLALVKGVVLAANTPGQDQEPLTQGPDVLLDGFESQLGQPFPARLRVELARSLAGGGGDGGSEGDSEAALIDSISKNVSQLVEAAQAGSAAETAMALLESRFGPRAAPMFRALGHMVSEGGVDLPSLDPESLFNEMAEEIAKRGSDAVVDVWERKLGRVLPEDVRMEVEKVAQDFANQISKAYAEGGLSAFMASVGDITPDAVTSAAARAGEIVEAGLDRVQSTVEGGLDKVTTAASQLLEGNISSLLDENGCLALPMPKKLMSGTMAGALTAVSGGAVTDALDKAVAAAADGLDKAAAAGQSVTAAAQQFMTDGLAALDEGQKAMEAALSGGDFTALAALAKGRAAALVSGGAAAALQLVLADWRSQLVAQGGDVMDAAASSLGRLVDQMQSGLEAALAKTQRLAEGVLAAANGEGWGALAEALGMDPQQLLDSLKGPEALREGAAAALEALQNGAGSACDAVQAGAEAGLDSAGQLLEGGVAGDVLANGLGALTRSPAARSLLGGFVERQLLGPEARERAAALLRELRTASEQFSLGVDLDLGVDVAALFEEQEQFREVLMTMLEMLNIDEIV